MMSIKPVQPVELWLVRHGQTDWNTDRRFQGQTDIPLNAVGVAQARNLAETLNDAQISAIYSSDLNRALQTASILAENRNIPIIKEKRLREINMGAWEGRTVQDVTLNLADELMELANNPIHGRAPGGESLAEVASRVKTFADEIALIHPGQSVMAVTHRLTLGALHCLAEGIPLSQAREFNFENCTILRVKWSSNL